MTRRRGLFGLRRLRNGFASVATKSAGGQVQEQPNASAASARPVPTTKNVASVLGRREPTLREIRDRAYYIYLARGGVDGDPAADWLRAERELREEFQHGALNE